MPSIKNVKGVSAYKPRVVIHEIFLKNRFFKFHESQQNQHTIYKLRHLYEPLSRYVCI